MFLISKIVRGRRLLHELQAEAEKKEAEEAAAAAAATAAIRRSGQASRGGRLPSGTPQVYWFITSDFTFLLSGEGEI